jgi:hypothetical protein
LASTNPSDNLDPERRAGRLRALVFAAFCAACTLATTAYVLWSAARAPAASAAPQAPTPLAAVSGALSPLSQSDAALLDEIRSRPHVYVRSTREGELGRIVVASLSAPNERRVLLDRTCERAHFGRTRGVCLASNPEGAQPQAFAWFLGGEGTPSKHSLAGVPSRVRVARDERLAASTVFVTGDDYHADFSTRTTLFELPAGKLIADLEQFTVYRDGHAFRAIDFNFWGVTFAADSNVFYATLRSAGETYLVQGNVKARTMQVLTARVECPSLSPDQTRIAFKKRVGRGDEWRLWVLELASLRQHPIDAELRSVDDQVEWLDDGHILYGMPDEGTHMTGAANVWVSSVDEGAAKPRIFVGSAASPAVVRHSN